MKQKGKQTLKLVEDYFIRNPDALQIQAAKDLGLSNGTITKYFKMIKNNKKRITK